MATPRPPVQVLIDLCQLDIDAVRAYEQAIEACEHTFVADELRRFQGDHERHIRELSVAIRGLGGTPPERKPDAKGFVIEAFTAIRSMTGTAGALKAMDSNEMLTTSRYQAALDQTLPAEARSLVSANYADEKRHLDWIRNAIRRQVWNQAGPSPSV